VVSAVAARAHGDRIALYHDGEDRFRLLVNGQAIDAAASGTVLKGGATLAREGERVVLTWKDGSRLFVWIRHAHLDVNLVLPASRTGKMQGLTGNNNDRVSDDLMTSGGMQLPAAIGFRDFYAMYVDSWRVNDQSSLFDYARGTDTSTFTDRAFPSMAFDSQTLTSEQRADAEALCRLYGVNSAVWLDACIMDVAITGDADFAQSAARAVEPVATLASAGTPRCGDGIVDASETCDGNCPSRCDDGDACTSDALLGTPATCDVSCTHTPDPDNCQVTCEPEWYAGTCENQEDCMGGVEYFCSNGRRYEYRPELAATGTCSMSCVIDNVEQSAVIHRRSSPPNRTAQPARTLLKWLHACRSAAFPRSCRGAFSSELSSHVAGPGAVWERLYVCAVEQAAPPQVPGLEPRLYGVARSTVTS
jgi:hypothetical protein